MAADAPGSDLTGWAAIAPDQRIGHFVLRRFYAQGGLGQVWIAFDEQLGREVAMKLIRPELEANARARQRFVVEAQIAGQLEHPNIVPVYELGSTPDGRPYYCMKLVPGETLADTIRRFHARPPNDPEAALEWRRLLEAFVGICHAMAYAHERGVIHRDLKPNNVIWGEYGEALVLDWGLARRVEPPPATDESETGLTPPPQPVRDAQGERSTRRGAKSSTEQEPLAREPSTAGQSVAGTDGVLTATTEYSPTAGPVDERLTGTGVAVGTLPYMSPEQAAGRRQDVDARSDIYSLGAILYVILTNRRPFDESDPVRLLVQVLERSPARPRQIDPRVPRALEAICTKAMARARDARYASAHDLARDVERWLADEPVSCFRDPWLRRLRRWVGRHRTTTAVLGVLAVVLSAAAVIAYHYHRTEQVAARIARLSAEAHQLITARREPEALQVLRDARRLADTVAAKPELGRAIDEELAALERAALSRVRRERFSRLFAQVFSQWPQRSSSDDDARLLDLAEQALAEFRVLEDENWLHSAELDYLDAAEKSRLEEEVDALLEWYCETQKNGLLRSRSLTGVGVSWDLRDSAGAAEAVPRVLSVVADSPAAQAGIRQGDKILEISGVRTPQLTTDEELAQLLAAEPGTEVTLLVLHPDEQHAREIRLRTAADASPGMTVARSPQLVIFDVQPGSAAAQAGLHAGDLVLSLAGEPAEGALLDMQIGEAEPGTNAPVAWFLRLSRLTGPEVQFVALRATDRQPTGVTVAWDERHARTLERANLLFLVNRLRLFARGIGVVMRQRDPAMLEKLGIDDPDAPPQQVLERLFVGFGYPPEFVKRAVVHSTHAYPDFQKGLLRELRGEYALAIPEFQRELQRHPRHSESFYHIAMCRALARQPSEAISAWSAFIVLRPHVATGYFWRGQAFLQAGQADSAERDFAKAMELDAQWPAPRQALEQLRARKQ